MLKNNYSTLENRCSNLSPTLPILWRGGKRGAFTLAEVLITLVVIGVIAATVIPILQQNINERVNSSRQANIAFKVTQAMDKMKALGLLEKDYGTTEASEPSLKNLPVGFNKTEEFAYTTSSTTPIDFVMDVNGAKKPNQNPADNKYYDVRSFRAAMFGGDCPGSQVPDVGCVINLGTAFSAGPKITYYGNGYGRYRNGNSYDNYWAGAVSACEALSGNFSLPTYQTLYNLYSLTNKSKYSSIPSTGWYWSITAGADNYTKKILDFETGAYRTDGTYYRDNTGTFALCVGEL